MKRLKLLHIGNILLSLFLFSSVFSIVILICGYLGKITSVPSFSHAIIPWVCFTVFLIVFESVLFWIGIVFVYTTSIQLGVKTRILGAILGWIPIANIFMLIHMLSITTDEYTFEQKKRQINEKRKSEQLCKTKYPILLVHGVFFRDFKHFNYWGRIPDELEANGATIFHGNHNSAASVEDSSIELIDRIEEIKKETGCEKVNIIAHSKGGLDARCAIAQGAWADVASLTTINTPHRGCEFADYLLKEIPKNVQESITKTYNAAAEKLGDTDPNFLAAVQDLTHEKCEKRNRYILDSPNVYYQSVGSKLSMASGGKFPLNYSYHLVKYFDGNNDGLVGEDSFEWGHHYTFLTCKGKRGISHGDMIDLNRENIPGFDVREFYVSLVHDLKRKGY